MMTKLAKLRMLLAVLSLSILLAPAAFGQPYPNRPVRLVWAFSAGSAAHSSVLLIAQEATKILGQPVLVEIKPGAGGRIGLNEVMRSAPDGYTLGQATFAMLALQGAVDPKLKVEPGKDYQPLIALAELPYIMVAHPSMPFRDVKGFIAYVKANPGKLNVAGGSVNSDAYFGMLRLQGVYGLEYTLVPFKGTVDSFPAQLNNLVQVSLLNGGAKPHVESGKMIGLATTGARRWDILPNLPTLMEEGADLTIGAVSGIIAPIGMPDTMVQRLNQTFGRVMADAAVKKRFVEFGLVPITSTVDEYTKMIRAELEIWPPIIKKAGIKPGLN